MSQVELLHVERSEGLGSKRLGRLAGEDGVVGGGPLTGPPACRGDELLNALRRQLLSKGSLQQQHTRFAQSSFQESGGFARTWLVHLLQLWLPISQKVSRVALAGDTGVVYRGAEDSMC